MKALFILKRNFFLTTEKKISFTLLGDHAAEQEVCLIFYNTLLNVHVKLAELDCAHGYMLVAGLYTCILKLIM